MAIHTFSTTDLTEPEVKKLKEYCKKRDINFSRKVIQAIIKLNKELINEQQR